MLGEDAATGRRHGHAIPQYETVVGGLGHRRLQTLSGVEQAGFVHAAEARAPTQRRITKRRLQQVVQWLGSLRQRRFAALEQFLEQGLFGQVIHQLQGRNLGLALHHAQQLAAQRSHLSLAVT